jgi:hypothetical protein
MMRSLPLLQMVLLVLFSLASIGLAGLVYAELTWPDAPLADRAAPAAASPDRARNGDITPKFSLAPLQSFAAVTERPLFAQSRRPPPQGTEDALGPVTALVLAGVIISPTSREALIIHGKPPATVHVAEGQAVDGWVVTSILSDRIVLRGRSSEHELKLLEKAPPPGPQQPGAPRRPFNP